MTNEQIYSFMVFYLILAYLALSSRLKRAGVLVSK